MEAEQHDDVDDQAIAALRTQLRTRLAVTGTGWTCWTPPRPARSRCPREYEAALRLRRAVIEAQREELLRWRDVGRLPDEGLRALERELDHEEGLLPARDRNIPRQAQALRASRARSTRVGRPASPIADPDDRRRHRQLVRCRRRGAMNELSNGVARTTLDRVTFDQAAACRSTRPDPGICGRRSARRPFGRGSCVRAWP